MPTTSLPPRPTVSITVVESPACHFCVDAHQALQELAAEGNPIEVETLDVRGTAGQELMRIHGAGMSPLVLVNGDFFSQGRLPRRKLAKYLHQVPSSPHVAGV